MCEQICVVDPLADIISSCWCPGVSEVSIPGSCVYDISVYLSDLVWKMEYTKRITTMITTVTITSFDSLPTTAHACISCINVYIAPTPKLSPSSINARRTERVQNYILKLQFKPVQNGAPTSQELILNRPLYKGLCIFT
jgi:hypothetical protein